LVAIPFLCDVLRKERNYRFVDKRFWGVIHAVHILGILGNTRASMPSFPPASCPTGTILTGSGTLCRSAISDWVKVSSQDSCVTSKHSKPPIMILFRKRFWVYGTFGRRILKNVRD